VQIFLGPFEEAWEILKVLARGLPSQQNVINHQLNKRSGSKHLIVGAHWWVLNFCRALACSLDIAVNFYVIEMICVEVAFFPCKSSFFSPILFQAPVIFIIYSEVKNEMKTA
jgi:hypothetical protein